MSYNQIAMNWQKIYSQLKDCEIYGYINFINQLEIMILNEEKFYKYFNIEIKEEIINRKPTFFEHIKAIFSRIKSFLALDIKTR